MIRSTFDIHIASRRRTLVSIREFPLDQNRITFLFGESGIGKSLIAKALYGLIDPTELDVSVNDRPYAEFLHELRTREVLENGFFVFQEPSSHLHPLLTINEQLAEGSLAAAGDWRSIVQELWKNAPPSEIQDLLSVFPKPYRPSGGEKQRVLCAMAFMKMGITAKRNPDLQSLFVFDEPTGSLDNEYRDVFLSMLIRRFVAHPVTVLMITHDYSMIGTLVHTYGDVLDRMLFKEIALTGAGLELRDFSPRTYLEWVENQRPVRSGRTQAPGGKPLLTVEGGMSAFDLTLTITVARDHSTPSPLVINPGAMVYLKAPSGTGKTTFVKMLMGLVRGKNLQARLGTFQLTESTPRRIWRRHLWGKRMTMVFQHADEALNQRATVREVFRGLPIRSRVTDTTLREWLGLLFDEEADEEFLNRVVATLSGGQKQRLNLLRSVVLDTDILILDEPLNGLDFEATKRVIRLLQEKQQAGKGLLVISHNEEVFDGLVVPEDTYYLSRASVRRS